MGRRAFGVVVALLLGCSERAIPGACDEDSCSPDVASIPSTDGFAPGEVELGTPPAKTLATGRFRLLGTPPEGTLVAVVTDDAAREIRVYAATGTLLALPGAKPKWSAVARGESLYFSVGGTLSAWWPAWGPKGARTLTAELVGESAVIAPDGRWIGFSTVDSEKRRAVRLGFRDAALEAIPDADYIRMAPGSGHAYVILHGDSLAHSAVLRVGHGEPAGSAATECTHCGLGAFDTDGSHLTTYRSPEFERFVIRVAETASPGAPGIEHETHAAFGWPFTSFVPGHTQVTVGTTAAAAAAPISGTTQRARPGREAACTKPGPRATTSSVLRTRSAEARCTSCRGMAALIDSCRMRVSFLPSPTADT